MNASKARPRHQVRRIKERARYEREDVYRILDASWIAHVGFSIDGQPFVIPMLYARQGDNIFLHGSIASRLQQQLATGIDVCLSVTLIDGLVLAKSHFHHSTNYRSVVVFGRASAISDAADKVAALAHFVEAMIPGRSGESRAPDANELAATSVLRLEIADASAKLRTGGPKDDPADRELPVWAGVVPVDLQYGTAQPDSDLSAGIALPESVQRLFASKGRQSA
jgi:uncharacterized protein